MAKQNVPQGLFGVGNQLPHQYIISDLIYAVRSKFEKTKKYKVLSEISIDKLGTIYSDKKFTSIHNYDFVIVDAKTTNILLIIEIERAKKSISATNKKIFQSLLHIKTLQEAYIIKFDANNKIQFDRKAIKDNTLVTISKSSQSTLLD